MEYPHEFILPINENLEGRIVLNRTSKQDETIFDTEISLIFIESKKIFKHVGNFFNFTDKQEAIDYSVQKISNFLKHH